MQEECGYNVPMTTITTKLVRDGNSVAIRLPKTVLVMSGLHDEVKMEVKHGQITLSSARTPRSDWRERIATVVASDPAANLADEELNDWDLTSNDGVDHN
jgi:antitoxin component of MazEF toxin-antitoxin module